MAWIDDAISQLMMRMQLQSMQRDPFIDEAEIGRAPLDRVINPSFAGRHQLGERLHPNAMGILLDPSRPQPPGDEVIYGEPSRFNDPGIVTPSVARGEKNPMPLDTPMPGVAADENRRGIWERTLREDRGELDPQLGNMATRISNTGDPVTQLMLQMQLQQLMGGGDNSQFMPGLAPQGMPSPDEWRLLRQRQLAWEAQQRQQLSGLPEAVQRSILGQPSYGDTQNMPPSRPIATDVQREFDTHDPNAPTARNDQLETQLFYNRIFPRYDMPLPEGAKRPDLGAPQPMYPQPFDPRLQRGPFAFY